VVANGWDSLDFDDQGRAQDVNNNDLGDDAAYDKGEFLVTILSKRCLLMNACQSRPRKTLRAPTLVRPSRSRTSSYRTKSNPSMRREY
jgi:hypothetical protein